MEAARRLWEEVAGDEVGALLARGSAGAFVIKVVGAGLAFGVHVLLARVLGVGAYGDYVYVYTWVTVLVLIGRMGMDKGVLRFAPEYVADERWGLLRGFLRYGVGTVVAASLVLAAVGWCLVWLLRDQLGQGLVKTFWVGLAALPFLALLHFGEGALQSFKQAVRALSPRLVFYYLAMGLGITALYAVTGRRLHASEAMAVTLAATVGAVLVSAGFVKRRAPEAVFDAKARLLSRRWLRYAAPMMFIAAMNLVLKRTDLLMIGSIIGTEEAGIYGAATRVSEIALFGLQSVNVIVTPVISELYHVGEHEQLQKVVGWTASAIFAVTMALVVPLAVAGEFALGLFGREFVDGYGVLLILLGGQMANALAGSVGFLMVMTGHQDQAAMIFGTTAVLNLVLNAVLIPLLGVVGGAVATALATVIWNVWMIRYVASTMEIDPTVRAVLKS